MRFTIVQKHNLRITRRSFFLKYGNNVVNLSLKEISLWICNKRANKANLTINKVPSANLIKFKILTYKHLL